MTKKIISVSESILFSSKRLMGRDKNLQNPEVLSLRIFVAFSIEFKFSKAIARRKNLNWMGR